jgi:hypothetical protein
MMLVTKIPAVRKKYYENIRSFPSQRFKALIERVD